MFGKLFGRKDPAADAAERLASVLREVAEATAGLVGDRARATDRLYCLASYAGRVTQLVAVHLAERDGAAAGPPDFNDVRTVDGSIYLFGDGIHRQLLAERPPGPYWQIANSVRPPLDLDEYRALARRAAETVGGEEYGVPQVDPAFRPSLAVAPASMKLAEIVPAIMKRHEVPASEWPSVLGRACADEIRRLEKSQEVSRDAGARLAAEALICGSHLYRMAPAEDAP